MTRKRGWATVFHRSRLSRFVWVVDADWESRVWQVITEHGLPEVSWSSMFSNAYTSAALLDGLVIRLSTYGFPSMPSGTRVVGPRAVRWLSYQVDLNGPSRTLAGEDHIPTRDELGAEVHEQLDHLVDLEERARIGLGVADRDSLLGVVRELFGDAAAPRTPSPSDPAPEPLGSAGFTRWQAESLIERNISNEDALRFREEEFSPEDVRFLAGRDINLVREWRELGLGAYDIAEVIDGGITLDVGRSLLQAGCTGSSIAAFASQGLGSSDYSQWAATGLDGDVMRVLVRNGVHVLEASRWRRLNLKTWDVAPLLEAGGDIEWAENLVSAGIRDNISDWVKSGVELEECSAWSSRGIPPAVAGALRQAGVSPVQASLQWRRGRHSADTIIRSIEKAAKRPDE